MFLQLDLPLVASLSKVIKLALDKFVRVRTLLFSFECLKLFLFLK